MDDVWMRTTFLSYLMLFGNRYMYKLVAFQNSSFHVCLKVFVHGYSRMDIH